MYDTSINANCYITDLHVRYVHVSDYFCINKYASHVFADNIIWNVSEIDFFPNRNLTVHLKAQLTVQI